MTTHRARAVPGHPHRYVFESTWDVPAPTSEIVDVLADVDDYATWWPSIRKVRRVSDGQGLMTLRSAVPFNLTFELRRNIEDRAQGHLSAIASGDIDGAVEWRLRPSPGGTKISFTQDVELMHPWVRQVDRFIRPLLEWNHAVAMRAGARGLERHLRDQSRPARPR